MEQEQNHGNARDRANDGERMMQPFIRREHKQRGGSHQHDAHGR